MTWIDWTIVVALALSTLYGLWRGLVREVFSLAGWVLAFVFAALFGGAAAGWMPAAWDDAVRGVAGHVAVFVLVLIAGALGGMVASRFVRAVGLGAADRLTGAAFGALRGILIVFALAIVASLSSLPRSAAWKDARLMPYVLAGLHAVRGWLPEGAARVVQASAGTPAGVACGAPPCPEGA